MIDLKKVITGFHSHAADTEDLKARIIEKLRTIYDPEIPVNIYDLGLVYELDVTAAGEVHVRMTLTAPNCPVAGGFPDMVQSAIWLVEGVNEVTVELVWDPPWNKDLITEAARLQLGML
jgi:FeS assembly SUF system protein